MKPRSYQPLRAVLASALLVFTLSGCKVFDDLVAELMDSGGLSSRNIHKVSCIDLLVIRDGPVSLESDLAPKLRKAVMDGFAEAQNTEKGKNLKLAQTPDKKTSATFYERVLTSDGVAPEKRREYLSEVCDKLDATMLLWGVYSGDDAEIKVICFLYRKNLNDFVASDPLTFTDKMPERVQKEELSSVVKELFEKSLPEPGSPDTRKISKSLKDAGDLGKALLPAIGAYLLSN